MILKVRQKGVVSEAPDGSSLKAGDVVDLETTFEHGRTETRFVGKSQSVPWVAPKPRVVVPSQDGWHVDVPALRAALMTIVAHRELLEEAVFHITSGQQENVACIETALQGIVEDNWRPRPRGGR